MKTEKGVRFDFKINIMNLDEITKLHRVIVKTEVNEYHFSFLQSNEIQKQQEAELVQWLKGNEFLPLKNKKVFIYNKWYEI